MTTTKKTTNTFVAALKLPKNYRSFFLLSALERGIFCMNENFMAVKQLMLFTWNRWHCSRTLVRLMSSYLCGLQHQCIISLHTNGQVSRQFSKWLPSSVGTKNWSAPATSSLVLCFRGKHKQPKWQISVWDKKGGPRDYRRSLNG